MQTQAEEDNLMIAKRSESEDFGSQRFLDGLSEDIEWWAAGPPSVLPWAGMFKGRANVANRVKILRHHLNYQKWEPDWLVKADTVVEFVRASGVAKTTGQHYESDIVRIWTIRDGKVVKVRSFYDTAAYAIAIDALKLAFQGGHYFKYLEPGRNLAWRHCRP